MQDRNNLTAYLATIGGIVLLAIVASGICLFAKIDTEVTLGKVLGALGFISAAIAGLTGIAGTFKASASHTPVGSTETGDVNVTGDAK